MDVVTTALAGRPAGRGGARGKYAACPINELDLSSCERCTASYVRLPADYPKYTFTARYGPVDTFPHSSALATSAAVQTSCQAGPRSSQPWLSFRAASSWTFTHGVDGKRRVDGR